MMKDPKLPRVYQFLVFLWHVILVKVAERENLLQEETLYAALWPHLSELGSA